MRGSIVDNLISRVGYYLRQHGLRETIDQVITRIRTRLYLDETHVWYELVLATDRPRPALRPGLELIRARADNLSLLEELPTVSTVEGRLRMERGNDLWLVLDGRQPVFACWTFSNSAPVVAATNGRLDLKPEIAYLEDSVTSPSYRGRGAIAPAAWSQLADRLEKAGVQAMITKVGEDNKVMRWAIVKSGFREIAVMHFRRRGLRERAAIRVGTDATARWLAGQLAR
jgi:Acetyltransferase (GNAT) family